MNGENMDSEKDDFLKIKKNNMESGERFIESPIRGSLIKLEDIKDDEISSGILGQGVGVIPEEGIVRAPFNGSILSLFPTMHALGMKADDGMQILIHIGIHTSELEGKYFKSFIKQGERVVKGQQLLWFDVDAIKGEGYDVTSAVIITNHEDYENIKFVMI